MGLLEDGENMLCDVYDSTEFVTIDYLRRPFDAPNTITGIKATIGSIETELEDDAFTMQETQRRDFIITASQLDLGGRFHPDEGERIQETKNGVTYTYEVVNLFGVGTWRWHGAAYKSYRIYTQLITEA